MQAKENKWWNVRQVWFSQRRYYFCTPLYIVVWRDGIPLLIKLEFGSHDNPDHELGICFAFYCIKKPLISFCPIHFLYYFFFIFCLVSVLVFTRPECDLFSNFILINGLCLFDHNHISPGLLFSYFPFSKGQAWSPTGVKNTIKIWNKNHTKK